MTTRTMGRLLLLACALTAGWVGWDATARQASGWRFTLPEGDPSLGEAVFVKERCGVCHNVAGRDLAAGGGQQKGAGPDLTEEQAALSAEYLAERLITPERFLPHGLFRGTYSRSDGSSRMPNFNEEMTVKELIDLVAFLKSIGRP